ncbi:MAG: hypothetical protein HQL48_07610, partial [Gammaproteobacteria bacterium]|nr:hypothetical protein [Gammaproteobacteria bacterium]
MKPLRTISWLLLLLLPCTVTAFELKVFWDQHQISTISAEKGMVRLSDPQQRLFQLYQPEQLDEASATELISLLSLFYGWKQIEIAKLDFTAETGSLRALIYPKSLHHQGRDYL